MLLLKDVLPHFKNKKTTLADALGITRQAISQWDKDLPIPEVHELRLRYELLPGKFGDACVRDGAKRSKKSPSARCKKHQMSSKTAH